MLLHEVLGSDRHVLAGELRPPQAVQITQTALARLEVRLDREADVVGAVHAFADRDGQPLQPEPGPLAPLALRLLAQVVGDPAVAEDDPRVEDRRHRVEVVAGERDRVADRPDRVAQLHPGVPDRVPDGRAEGVAGRLPTDQQEIEVAVGRQRGPSVPAQRDQGHTGRDLERPDDLAQPGVDRGRVGTTRVEPTHTQREGRDRCTHADPKDRWNETLRALRRPSRRCGCA